MLGAHKYGKAQVKNVATIKDIAKYAGVSIGTVDRVLHGRGRVSGETRQKIEEAVKQLQYTPNAVAQGLAANKKKFHLCFFVPDAARNPFFADITAAAQAQAQKLAQYGVSVQILTLAMNGLQAEYDPSLFPEAYAQAAAEADGIALPGVVYPGLTECITALAARKMPLVFYNSLTLPLPHLAYVGCDYRKSGRLAAGLAALAGGEAARVGIFSQALYACGARRSTENLDSYASRLAGFRAEMQQRYPAMQILDCYNIDRDRAVNAQTVQQALRAHPDMNLVYVVNPADYEICTLLRAADPGRRLRIITNDLCGSQIRMVEDGTIAATICQEPEKQGALPLTLLYRYLAYGRLPVQEDCYTKLSIHIAQNLL